MFMTPLPRHPRQQAFRVLPDDKLARLVQPNPEQRQHYSRTERRHAQQEPKSKCEGYKEELDWDRAGLEYAVATESTDVRQSSRRQRRRADSQPRNIVEEDTDAQSGAGAGEDPRIGRWPVLQDAKLSSSSREKVPTHDIKR